MSKNGRMTKWLYIQNVVLHMIKIVCDADNTGSGL